MLDHLGYNVSDMARSKAFYAAVLGALGYRITRDFGVAVGFAVTEGAGKSSDAAGEFWIVQGEPSKPGIHVAFSAATRSLVDAFHKAALAAGGTDNGAPGLRPQYHEHYYGAFIHDPDGYNIEAVCHMPLTP